jgi:hypothetical protein
VVVPVGGSGYAARPIYRVSILGNMRTCSPATSAIAMGGADGVEKLDCDLRCSLGEGDSDSWP